MVVIIQGYAIDEIDTLMKVHSGSWQLKYSVDNKTGMAFWKKIRNYLT